MRNKMLLIGLIGIVIGVLLSTAVVFAGNLNPGVGPTGAGSQMYTLQQIYTGPAQPDAGSISTGSGIQVWNGHTCPAIVPFNIAGLSAGLGGYETRLGWDPVRFSSADADITVDITPTRADRQDLTLQIQGRIVASGKPYRFERVIRTDPIRINS